MKVHLIHGLEGSPNGNKARFLAEHFDLTCPSMDTSDFNACVELHAALIKKESPKVLVGSSFGGAVACALIARGDWTGATVLLASAWKKYGVAVNLGNVPTLVVHGVGDTVIPVGNSRELTKAGSNVILAEVDDGHRLHSLVTSGELIKFVRWISE